MLIAKTLKGQVLAWEALRKHKHKCPICDSPVILKQGKKVIHHFAHCPRSGCDNAGESISHMEIKKMIHMAWQGSKMEWPLVKNRRCDICDPLAVAAVEIQCSAISEDEMMCREHDYSPCFEGLFGFYWMWDWKFVFPKYSPRRPSNLQDSNCFAFPMRIPKCVLVDAEAQDGYIYAVSFQTGLIYRVRLDTYDVQTDAWYIETGSGTYTPKTKREVTVGPAFSLSRKFNTDQLTRFLTTSGE